MKVAWFVCLALLVGCEAAKKKPSKVVVSPFGDGSPQDGDYISEQVALEIIRSGLNNYKKFNKELGGVSVEKGHVDEKGIWLYQENFEKLCVIKKNTLLLPFVTVVDQQNKVEPIDQFFKKFIKKDGTLDQKRILAYEKKRKKTKKKKLDPNHAKLKFPEGNWACPNDPYQEILTKYDENGNLMVHYHDTYAEVKVMSTGKKKRKNECRAGTRGFLKLGSYCGSFNENPLEWGLDATVSPFKTGVTKKLYGK